MLEALKLDHITISDKFLMMEELWESMRKETTAKYFTPQWHLDILDSIMSDIESLYIYASIHMQIHGYYRLLSKRFLL